MGRVDSNLVSSACNNLKFCQGESFLVHRCIGDRFEKGRGRPSADAGNPAGPIPAGSVLEKKKRLGFVVFFEPFFGAPLPSRLEGVDPGLDLSSRSKHSKPAVAEHEVLSRHPSSHKLELHVVICSIACCHKKKPRCRDVEAMDEASPMLKVLQKILLPCKGRV